MIPANIRFCTARLQLPDGSTLRDVQLRACPKNPDYEDGVFIINGHVVSDDEYTIKPGDSITVLARDPLSD